MSSLPGPNGVQPPLDPLVGQLARTLMAEDARWLRDTLLAAHAGEGSVRSAVPLLLTGTAARVVYEAMNVLRTKPLDVNLSTLLQQAPENLDPLVARARHATKLLDDTKRSVTDMVSLLEQYSEAHRRLFVGRTRLQRWLSSDLGLIQTGPHVVGATVPLQLRLGLPVDADLTTVGPFLRTVAEQMGGALSVIAACDLNMGAYQAPSAPHRFPAFKWRDVESARYLADRYDPSLPLPVKMMLLMIETELQTSARFLPTTASPVPPAAMRARYVSLYHSLSSLRVLTTGGLLPTDSAAARQLQTLVLDPPVLQVLSRRRLKMLRNQYVHYIFRGNVDDLDPSLQDLGVVRAISGDAATANDLDEAAVRTLSDLIHAMSAWKS